MLATDNICTKDPADTDSSTCPSDATHDFVLAHLATGGALDGINGVFGLSPSSNFVTTGYGDLEHKLTFDLNKDENRSVYVGSPNMLEQVGYHAPVETSQDNTWSIEINEISRDWRTTTDDPITHGLTFPMNAEFDLS